MSVLGIFLEEFWPMLLVTTITLPLIWWGRVISLGRNASSLGPKDFPELASLPKDERLRMLHDADRKAFGGWRFILPALMYSVVLSAGIAAAQTLGKAGVLPGSFWTTSSTALVLVGSGIWIVRRLEAYRIRPFLWPKAQDNTRQ